MWPRTWLIAISRGFLKLGRSWSCRHHCESHLCKRQIHPKNETELVKTLVSSRVVRVFVIELYQLKVEAFSCQKLLEDLSFFVGQRMNIKCCLHFLRQPWTCLCVVFGSHLRWVIYFTSCFRPLRLSDSSNHLIWRTLEDFTLTPRVFFDNSNCLYLNHHNYHYKKKN